MVPKLFRNPLLAAVLMAPIGAFAGSIRIDFTITATQALDIAGANVATYDGFGPGATGTGSFVFDDSVGTFVDTIVGRAVSDFSFEWLGKTWGDGSAFLDRLTLDASGNILSWGFGAPISGIDAIYTAGPADFWVYGFAPGETQNSNGIQHNEGVDGAMWGDMTWTATKVPEPGTFALMAIGFAGIFMLVRRSRYLSIGARDLSGCDPVHT